MPINLYNNDYWKTVHTDQLLKLRDQSQTTWAKEGNDSPCVPQRFFFVVVVLFSFSAIKLIKKIVESN